MKIFCGFILIVVSAIVFSGILSVSETVAAEGTCYLQATNTDVFVKVFDLDREGNMGRMVWEGRINEHQSVKITMPHGRFRYYFNAQPDEDQPLSGGIDRWCINNHSVLVP